MADKNSDGPSAQVSRGAADVQVEILPDVHARINGKPVEPGETAFVDGACAISLVTQGHAKIVGSK